MPKKILALDGSTLSLEAIESFLQYNTPAKLASAALKKMKASRALIDAWIREEQVIYGVTTGFGEFSNVNISAADRMKLQENLIISHAVGCGDPLPPFIVKTMMLLRVNALAKGYSGIRIETVNKLLAMMNENILPVIPSQGSVGSSGDLVPLAHLVLGLLGRGNVNVLEHPFSEKLQTVPASEALRTHGLEAAQLEAKEGLALINGTQMMTAFAAYCCIRAQKIKKLADISAAMTHEALRGTDTAFDARLHALRPYKGQQTVAANMRKLIEKSEIRESHREHDARVQDAYSLRCIPQIHGASRDTIDYVCSIIGTEINSATDNPLIFTDPPAHLEGGNFHGQPVALVMDFLGIALAELANVSERRIERMVNGALSGLPRFLAKHGGLHSGLMIAQYTAASLVSENKVLAHPASVDSIPTSANQEDHNSMGSIAARKCYRILLNLENVLAIECMTAAQALEFLKPLKPGKGTGAALREIRNVIPPLDFDRELHLDLSAAAAIVRDNTIVHAVEKIISLD